MRRTTLAIALALASLGLGACAIVPYDPYGGAYGGAYPAGYVNVTPAVVVPAPVVRPRGWRGGGPPHRHWRRW